jgi:hypothetical protein
MLTFPLVVIVGLGVNVVLIGAETAEVQPPATVCTVKLPVLETVILWVVSPVFQRLPEAELEVRVTEPPVQKLVGPLAEMVGALGLGLTVTDKLCAVLLPHALLAVTVIIPPLAPAVALILLVEEVPVQPPGKVHV